MLDSKKKILIVDADDDQQHLMKTALEHNGYAVAVAAGAEYALLRVGLSRPDLILLDITPASQTNGLEVLRQLKASEDTASISVIVVSGVSGVRDRTHINQAREHGAADFLIKGQSIPELLMRVERVLGGDRNTSVGTDIGVVADLTWS